MIDNKIRVSPKQENLISCCVYFNMSWTSDFDLLKAPQGNNTSSLSFKLGIFRS